MKVRLFTIKFCPYCDKLKKLLTDDGIEFENIDIETLEGEIEFDPIYEKTKSDLVPTVFVNGTILVPEVSFTSIDMAFVLIKMIMENQEIKKF